MMDYLTICNDRDNHFTRGIADFIYLMFTFTILWANSADDKLMFIIIIIIIPTKQVLILHEKFAWNVKTCFCEK